MGVALTLLAGVAMLAVPVCIVVKVMTLFATTNSNPSRSIEIHARTARATSPLRIMYGESTTRVCFQLIFLAYNCRYANGGGVSFLYDVAAGTLYAQWSSN